MLYCHNCGYIFPEIEPPKKLIDIDKIKKEHEERNDNPKISKSEEIDILIDLFEFGGNKFSKKERRKIT